MTRRFEDIVAWQKAHQFVVMVYRTTRSFPDFEKFGLCSQFQRAAVSIAANIAEGYKKLSKADKLRFSIFLREVLKNVGITAFWQKTLAILMNQRISNLFRPFLTPVICLMLISKVS